MKHILVVDDEAAHRLMIRAVMEDDGWKVSEAGSSEEALALLAGGNSADIRVILLDVRLPGMSGPELLATLRTEYPNLPVVMLTAFGTVGSAVEAMKKGAFDYLTKPADNDELLTVAAKALDQSALLRENERLRERLAGNDPLAALVGDSSPMRRVKEFIRQAGPSEGTVLVLGESGTGKELIADALHALSPRAKNPLVKVNCAALPENLLESELFGFQKGAFTGAAKDKPGRFQLAHGGTLFLDEVGEMPVDLQSKLLRALQERVVEPLGSVRPVPVDVRIIAATNRDLREGVREGSFREDLYFRLNVLEVTAPPLRERSEDIPSLAGALLSRLCEKNRKNIRGITPEMLGALTRYNWPGNVRELENILERAIILGRSDMLGVESLPSHLSGPEAAQAALHPAVPSRSFTQPAAQPGQLAGGERETLERALDAHGGHREKTAEALGISRRTLQYKLKKYGLAKRS